MRLCWRRRLNRCRAVRRRIFARANLAGFLAGYSDSTFRLQQNLTRDQTIVSLVSGLQFARGKPNLLSVYVDRASHSQFCPRLHSNRHRGQNRGQLSRARKLSPARDITCSEISALIYQTLVATNRADQLTLPTSSKGIGKQGRGELGVSTTHPSLLALVCDSLTLAHTHPLSPASTLASLDLRVPESFYD